MWLYKGISGWLLVLVVIEILIYKRAVGFTKWCGVS